MSDFTHILLTRFNVKTGFRSVGTLDADWLAHRFDLFETFCLPSLRAQTQPDFRWLVFFDEETPEPFRERIERIAEWPTFCPVYISGLAPDALPSVIRPYLDRPYLITSRMDNDDAVARDFVATIQRAFDRQPCEFINPLCGYQLDLASARLYTLRSPANPFISLIESSDNPSTVWARPHNRLHTLGPTRNLDARPLWLQVIHDRNVRNAIKYQWRVPAEKLSAFAIGYRVGAENDHPLRIAVENGSHLLRRLVQRIRRRRQP